VSGQPRPRMAVGIVGVEFELSGQRRRVQSARVSSDASRICRLSITSGRIVVSSIRSASPSGSRCRLHHAYKLIVSHSHSCGPVIMLGGTPGGPCCPAFACPIPPPWGTIAACIVKLFCCDPNRFCIGCVLGCPSLLLLLKPLLPMLMSSASSMFVS
jgi:hypothetical protein